MDSLPPRSHVSLSAWFLEQYGISNITITGNIMVDEASEAIYVLVEKEEHGKTSLCVCRMSMFDGRYAERVVRRVQPVLDRFPPGVVSIMTHYMAHPFGKIELLFDSTNILDMNSQRVAFDPSRGSIVCVANRWLHQLDTATGIMTPSWCCGDRIHSMAMDSQGNLFHMDDDSYLRCTGPTSRKSRVMAKNIADSESHLCAAKSNMLVISDWSAGKVVKYTPEKCRVIANFERSPYVPLSSCIHSEDHSIYIFIEGTDEKVLRIDVHGRYDWLPLSLTTTEADGKVGFSIYSPRNWLIYYNQGDIHLSVLPRPLYVPSPAFTGYFQGIFPCPLDRVIRPATSTKRRRIDKELNTCNKET